jgi:hypothetical protein
VKRTSRSVTYAMLALLLLPAACTSGASNAPGRPAASKLPAASTGPVLAFLAGNTITVANGNGDTHVVAMADPPPAQLLWSPDGTRLAWIDPPQDEESGGTVHVVDAVTGAAKTYPCPCHGLAFLGADMATVSADGAHLLLISPQGDATRVAFKGKLTNAYTAQGAEASATLIAGGKTRVTVALPLGEIKYGVRGNWTLDAIDRSGTVIPLFHGKQGAAAWEGLASPAGNRIAWREAPSSGACWADQRIIDLPYAGGEPIDPAVPTIGPLRRAHLPDQRIVQSYSWAGDDVVQTFGPLGGECQVAYPFRLVSYYRHGPQWTYLATGLLGIAYGADGRTAKLEPDSSISAPEGREFTGDLVYSRPGAADRTLGTKVGLFSFTPTESAAAQISTDGAPPPAAATLVTTDDHGAALNGPLYDAVRQVWSAAHNGDSAGLQALCHDCDSSTLTWLSKAGPAGVERLLTTHPHGFENSLTYPGLTLDLCADTTGSPATCTPEQLADIVTLDVPSDVSLDYPTNVYQAPKSQTLRFELEDGKGVWAGRA